MVIGHDLDHIVEAFSVRFERCTLWVATEVPIAPQLWLVAEDLLLIGCNREVYGVRLRACSIAFQVDLDGGPFVQFATESLDRRLVICETGALAIDDRGHKLWSYHADIVTRWQLLDGKLRLEFLDEPAAVVDVEKGVALIA